MKTVQVLMSTYNGEKYLKEQLESIAMQTGVEVHLLVRDDGSKDETWEILKQYKDIEIVKGQNVGATKSFLELIRLAGSYDFYAFADQDDVWDLDKLAIAVGKLESLNGPAIYSSNTRLVDGNLNFIRNETLNPITTLGSAFVKNYVTGCTAVFNFELMKFLKMYEPKHAPFHDWWANLVCLSVGGISLFDYNPHMNYRQHGNNVVGGNDTLLKKWISRLKKFKRPYHRNLMAQEIMENYEVMDTEKRLLTSLMESNYSKSFKTGNSIDDLLFKICLKARKI